MALGTLDGARQTVEWLARNYKDGLSEGFTPLVDVMGDVGRSLADPDPEALRRFLPSVAYLRERLEYDDSVHNTPWKALSLGEKSSTYAAGSLWTCSTMVNGVLRRIDADSARASARADRQFLRDLTTRLLAERGAVRPSEILDACKQNGLESSKSLVSKTLGDLLEEGVITVAEPPRDADRRHRYYRSASDRDQQRQLREGFARLLSEALQNTSPSEARSAFEDALRLQASS